MATKQQQVMSNQREKIINAIQACRVEDISVREMEHFAKLYTDELIDVLINELYEKHKALKDNISACNVETKRLLDIIENGNNL